MLLKVRHSENQFEHPVFPRRAIQPVARGEKANCAIRILNQMSESRLRDPMTRATRVESRLKLPAGVIDEMVYTKLLTRYRRPN